VNPQSPLPPARAERVRVRGASSLACLAALLLAACGPGGERTTSARADQPFPTAAPGGHPSDASFAFTASDLDALEKGLAKETELVLDAREREKSARVPDERAAAVRDQWKTSTAPKAAAAIGADPARYLATRRAVDRVLETLDLQGKIRGRGKANPEPAAAEPKARLESDPFSDLPPASAEALKSHLDRIVPLWIRYTTLTAANG